jgi:sterol desaturase/sphingolipid hydroxylase (fatty acid hydroxylase superfamily)
VLDATINWLGAVFGELQQWLFENAVQPVLFRIGLGNLVEDAFEATGWLLLGLMQLLVIGTLFGALQRLRPVERVTDRRAVRVDIVYTLVHRLGVFRVAMFFAIAPLWDQLFGRLSLLGWQTVQLDEMVAPLLPGVTDKAWFAFVVYLLVFDFVDYWLHRGQHQLRWWWALHALHHSQRQMTMWSDNRNHLLDDLIRDVVLVLVARVIGVPPGQFIALVVLTQLVESLSHANARVCYGWLGERLLVSPRFHRLHHSIGLGHESSGRGSLGGHNFAVLFPIWDIVFGTADFNRRLYPPTGIRDQLPESGSRDYGSGFWSQQWRGLQRLVGAA